ncbi:MAG: arsenite methyltransferase [Chloroflexi bacterium]|nr:arsenite methyltransferase [Chloroflexota bacterium]
MTDVLRDHVRDRYAEAARAVTHALEDPGAPHATIGCCGPSSTALPDAADEGRFGASLYSATESAELPEAARLASLGCGNPTAVADLREGETVLDLGSGGGIDVLLSAKRVGPSGRAYGLDMTDEMLELALRNQAEVGATNVQFLKGNIEAIPLPAATVDVVISNCVINLSTDKPAVFAEMARVLRPGGRIGISDVVADDSLTPAQRAERGSYVGCIAGALSFSEYRDGLRAAGFEEVSVVSTHSVGDGLHSAIVKAVRGAEVSGVVSRPTTALPVIEGSCC